MSASQAQDLQHISFVPEGHSALLKTGTIRAGTYARGLLDLLALLMLTNVAKKLQSA